MAGLHRRYRARYPARRGPSASLRGSDDAVDVQQMLQPSRVGQATAVEQSRAIAEVQAAIVVGAAVPPRRPAGHPRDARLVPAEGAGRPGILPLQPRRRPA